MDTSPPRTHPTVPLGRTGTDTRSQSCSESRTSNARCPSPGPGCGSSHRASSSFGSSNTSSMSTAATATTKGVSGVAEAEVGSGSGRVVAAVHRVVDGSAIVVGAAVLGAAVVVTTVLGRAVVETVLLEGAVSSGPAAIVISAPPLAGPMSAIRTGSGAGSGRLTLSSAHAPATMRSTKTIEPTGSESRIVPV